MRRTLQICISALVMAIVVSGAFPQDSIAQLRSRFAQESDPVRKAKQLPSLGSAEFGRIQKEAGEGHLADALAVLQSYRDEARSCVKGLDATGVDAEKHSAGFKQLQISLRESLRRLDALLPGMTSDEQGPFLVVRRDLDEMNRHVIEELFPRRAPAGPQPARPPE